MELKLNKETISLVVAVFGVIGSVWGLFTWVQNGRAENSPVVRELQVKQVENEQRLDRTDRDRERFTNSIDKLSGRTENLTVAVEKLTTTIELSEIGKKRAETYDIPLLPSQSPVAVRPERRK